MSWSGNEVCTVEAAITIQKTTTRAFSFAQIDRCSGRLQLRSRAQDGPFSVPQGSEMELVDVSGLSGRLLVGWLPLSPSQFLFVFEFSTPKKRTDTNLTEGQFPSQVWRV